MPGYPEWEKSMLAVSEELNRLAFMSGLRTSAIYVALIVIMALVLTHLVINQRRSKLIGLGDGGDKTAARLIRVHANFCENAPFALALLVLLPLLGAVSWVIHAVGILFLAGRVAHAWGLSQTGGSSIGRVAGMVVTHISLILGAVALLVAAFSR
jgi:uncharacterized protein